MNVRVLQIRRRLHHHAALFAPHKTMAVKAGEIRALLTEFDELERRAEVAERRLHQELVAAAEQRIDELHLVPVEERYVLRN